MPDYQKGKIYKIVDLNEEMIYFGSTCQQYLCQRMSTHRSSYKKLNNYCSSHDIFDKYGVENCKILLIENYPCNSKEELLKKEGEYIRQLNCVNKTIPDRTLKEYKKLYTTSHKNEKKQYDKIYREDNKDEIIKKKKKYNDENRDKIKEYNKQYQKKKVES